LRRASRTKRPARAVTRVRPIQVKLMLKRMRSTTSIGVMPPISSTRLIW